MNSNFRILRVTFVRSLLALAAFSFSASIQASENTGTPDSPKRDMVQEVVDLISRSIVFEARVPSQIALKTEEGSQKTNASSLPSGLWDTAPRNFLSGTPPEGYVYAYTLKFD